MARRAPQGEIDPSMGVEEALAGLLDPMLPGAPVAVTLDDALGLVLAQDVFSQEQHPADDMSAMDGYAVEASSLRHATSEAPIALSLLEDIRAGYPPERVVGEGQTSRISTGGLLPQGANAVEMREYVEIGEDSSVIFHRPIEAGANVRRAGEHLQVGEEVISSGQVLGPADLGMAAHLGLEELLCFPRLEVAILATGSELAEQGSDLSRGQIRDSNGVALSAAARSLGCTVTYRQRVADDEAALDEAISVATSKASVLLTSGGISAGWHDLVRDRIESSGGTFAFHQLRMRPGKPIAFGRLGEVWVFCLPGNPVSSGVTFEVFVKPALLKLMGRPWKPRTVKAVLTEPLEKKPGFTVFFRVKLERRSDGSLAASLSGPQASHQLKSMVAANGLLVAGEETGRIPAGTEVEVRLIRDLVES